MKKKNLISLLVVGAMVGTLLTGCNGKDTKVSKVDEDTYKIEVSTEATEVAESTEEVTEETTESTEEAVAEDFLSQHGIVPLDSYYSVDLTLGVGSDVNGTLTDETVKVESEVIGMIFNDEVPEGYVCEGIEFMIPQDDYSFSIQVFDRYTGTDLGKEPADLDEGDVNENAIIVDVDGKQYDCTLNADMRPIDGGKTLITVKVTHPVEYDGVVYGFGAFTKTLQEAEKNIDTSNPIIDDMYLNDTYTYFVVPKTW